MARRNFTQLFYRIIERVSASDEGDAHVELHDATITNFKRVGKGKLKGFTIVKLEVAAKHMNPNVALDPGVAGWVILGNRLALNDIIDGTDGESAMDALRARAIRALETQSDPCDWCVGAAADGPEDGCSEDCPSRVLRDLVDLWTAKQK